MTEYVGRGHPWDVDAVSSLPRATRTDRLDFETVYDATAATVWRLLGRLGVSASELDDALQDVFVIVHRQLSAFRRDSSPATWVSGIAVRVARDYRRRTVRKPSEDLGPHANALVDPRPGPEAITAAAQAARIVSTLLGRLDPDQREVFVLIELEQHTAPELAGMLGVPLNTVYSRLRLARGHFNELVEALQRGAR